MKVSGFTFVKNAVKYGYPVVESISSVLPVVDEMIVCLGDSEDTTRQLVDSIGSSKIKIIDSVWDDRLREGGRVLAVETDKALDETANDSDWLFYIQADEVIHEEDYKVIIGAMEKYKNDKNVHGLLFHYRHFYGSYRFIGDGRRWYSKEIRVIKNDKSIRSYRDAQGFRFNDNRKLNVKLINAHIYHYGWARNPVTMFQKYKDFGRHWTKEEDHNKWAQELETKADKFDYSSGIDSVMLFEGTHPQVMKKLVNSEDWNFNMDIKKKNFKNIKHKLLYFLWQKFGWRPFEYSNYKKV